MHLSPAEYVIHIIGGVRKTALLLSVDPSTVSRWQNQFQISDANKKKILELADKNQWPITAEDLIQGKEVWMPEKRGNNE